MSQFLFTSTGWEDYLYWQSTDKKVVKKINDLLKDIARNGALSGIGKPERLKGSLSGFYSRRIDSKNRLVYAISESGTIEVVQCRNHYDDK